jgi:hypothetical protein
VPADQRLKGRLGIPGGVFPHQVHVIRIGHLPIYYRPKRIRTFFFQGNLNSEAGRFGIRVQPGYFRRAGKPETNLSISPFRR